MWFSVVCTPIDNSMRHYSGQNLLWTHETHCDDAYSLSISVQTTLNHIQFVNVNISVWIFSYADSHSKLMALVY